MPNFMDTQEAEIEPVRIQTGDTIDLSGSFWWGGPIRYKPTPQIQHERLHRANATDPIVIRRNKDGSGILYAWGELEGVTIKLRGNLTVGNLGQEESWWQIALTKEQVAGLLVETD